MNYYNLISMMPKAPAYDADAQAFITATGISGTNASAINTLVLDLKAASIWTKMKAIYPIVGGTATTHKFNLKNPLDTNAAFRLSFVGGWTHSSNGVLPNGTNAYADTFLTPSTALTLNSTHLSVYIRTNLASLNSDIGSSNSSFVNGLYINSRFTSDNFAYSRTNGTDISFLNNDSVGFYLSSKTASTTTKFFKNTSGYISAATGTGLTSFKTILGGLNQANVITYSNREIAFASIGDGLTDAEALALYNSVYTFNTTLGRQL